MLRTVTVALIGSLAAGAAMAEPAGHPSASPSRSYPPKSVVEPHVPISIGGHRTIVGAWQHDDGVCTLADGAIEIAPLGLRAHDFVCNFDSVFPRSRPRSSSR